MENNGDVGLKEDMIYSLKNLVAIESHAKASFYTTGNKKWQELNDIIRDIRTRWLEKIVKKEEGSQIWCISKHLLNSFMGMEEVANRLRKSGEEELAKQADQDASTLYGLILVLNEQEEENVSTTKKT